MRSPDPSSPVLVLEIECVADLDAVEAVRAAVTPRLAGAGAAERDLNRLEVILEELIANIARHGVRPEGPATLRLSLSCDAAALTLVLEDDAAPFDPTARAVPEKARSLADAVPGGMGLVLVRKLSRRFEYERADGAAPARTRFRPVNRVRVEIERVGETR